MVLFPGLPAFLPLLLITCCMYVKEGLEFCHIICFCTHQCYTLPNQAIVNQGGRGEEGFD